MRLTLLNQWARRLSKQVRGHTVRDGLREWVISQSTSSRLSPTAPGVVLESVLSGEVEGLGDWMSTDRFS